MTGDNKKSARATGKDQKHFRMTALSRAIRGLINRRPENPHKQIRFESLEPRVLLSADPFTAALAVPFGDDWNQQSETLELSGDALAQLNPVLDSPFNRSAVLRGSDDPAGEMLVLGRSLDEIAIENGADNWIVDHSATQVQQHVVFVDSRVEGYESLLDGLLPAATDSDGPVPVIQVVLIDADRDGVEQISEYLADQQDVFAIHILAHGSSGSVSLGSATLDGENLQGYTAQLSGWGKALTSDADILLYGCDVASGKWGAQFVQNLAVLTGADVAASDDLTGNAEFGGDWDLEFTVGSIETLTLARTLDVTQLTGLLDDPMVEVVSNSGTLFPSFVVGSITPGSTLDLSAFSGALEWTISSGGEVTVTSGSSTLKVTGATNLLAGTGSNVFIIKSGAEFGSAAQAASITGNSTAGSTSTLSFTPNFANPDQTFTTGRVSAGVDVDLSTPAAVIQFSKVWLTVQGIDKVIGGKGSDTFEGVAGSSSNLVGGRGADRLLGGDQGGDVLEGGVGGDTLIGGLGGDTLRGGSDGDDLYGDREGVLGAGEVGGDDTLVGESGDDTYHFYDEWGDDTVTELTDGGKDTLDLTGVDEILNLSVGNSGTFVRIIDAVPDGDSLTANFVETIGLGTGANTITVRAGYLTNYASDSNTLTIDNEMTIGGTPLATLDLSAFAGQLTITVEKFVDGTNQNGNKVTVKFPSGTFETARKLIVFNVANITGTNADDTVVIEKDATLPGTLNTGGGDDLIIIKGDDDTTLASYVNRIGTIDAGAPGTNGDTLRYEGTIKGGTLAAGDTLFVGENTTDVAIGLTTGLNNYPVVGSVQNVENVALDGVAGWHNVYGDAQANTFVGGSGGDAFFGNDGADNLTGGKGNDHLVGGNHDDVIVGGKGDDLIEGGAGNDTMSGQGGADTYVFTDNWGVDTIDSGFTDSKKDTLDFSMVTQAMTYSLAAGRVLAGTGVFTHTVQSTPGFKNFNKGSGTFDTAAAGANVLTVNRAKEFLGASLRDNTISAINVNGTANQTFFFGNELNSTTINVPDDATGDLVLDFSAVTDKLTFEFKLDSDTGKLSSLVVTIGRTSPPTGTTITVTNINANTTIISGRNENIYRTAPGGTFDGQLILTGGYGWTQVPLTETSVPNPISGVDHIVDVSQGLADDLKALLADFKTFGSATFAALGEISRLNVGSALSAFAEKAGEESLIRSQVNLLANTSLFGEPGSPIPGIANGNVTYKAEGTVLFSTPKFTGIKFGTGINLLQGDHTGNTFEIGVARPGLHMISGLTGGDTYTFKNLWGAAAIIEVPDLTVGGVPIPEALDTLDFSGVIGENIIVDVYEGSLTDLVGIIGTAFDDSLPANWADSYAGLSVSTNLLVVQSQSRIPGVEGVTTSVMVANDIESLVGPTAGTLTIRLHGDANLRGTVSVAKFGDIVLDYSDYQGPLLTGNTSGVSNLTALVDSDATFITDGVVAGTLIFNTTSGKTTHVHEVVSVDSETQITTKVVSGPDDATQDWDFGDSYRIEQRKPVKTNLEAGSNLFPFELDLPIDIDAIQNNALGSVLEFTGIGDPLGIVPPPQTTGGASGISGVRFGGLSSIGDFISGTELLADFATTGVGTVIGSSLADTHLVGAKPKHYFLGAGDNILLDGSTTAAETDVTVDFSLETDGVTLNLATADAGNNLTIDGMTSTVETAQTIIAGAGNDTFIDSDELHTYVFGANWGTDTIVLAGGGDKIKFDFDLDGTTLVGAQIGQDLVVSHKLADGTTANTLTIEGWASKSASFAGDNIPDITIVADPVIGGLVATSTATPLATIEAADAEARLTDAIYSFDGKTLTLPGAIDPVTLSVEQETVDSVLVTRIVTDTATVLFESSQLSFAVADLAGMALVNRTDTGLITLDVDAAEHGWFSDATAPGAGDQGVDLVSVLIHEIALHLNDGVQQLALDGSLEFTGSSIGSVGRLVVPADLGTALATASIDLIALDVAEMPPGTLATDADLTALLDEALSRWQAQDFVVAGDPSADPVSALDALVVVIQDLGGEEIARTLADGTILLDYNAAGHGWFVDAAPFDDAEFVGGLAVADGEADGKVDLLTVIMHEVGHKLGLPHGSSELLSDTLDPGVRRGIPGGTLNLLTMDSSDAAKLDAGLGAMTSWAGGMGTRLDNLLAASPIPFIDISLAEILGVELGAAQLMEAATAKLRSDIAGLFGTDPVTTADVVALADTTSADFRYQIARAPSSDDIAFVATIDLLPAGLELAALDLSSLDLDGLLAGFSVDTNLAISITADLELQFTFGIDDAGSFYVQDPSLVAQVDVSSGATPFDANITLGPIGLGVNGGTIDFTGSMALVSRDRIGFDALLNQTVDPLSLDPVSAGSYNIDLPISLSGSLQGVTTNETAIRASGTLPGGGASLQALITSINPEFVNFDQLFQLRGISLDQLLDAISSGLDALIKPDGLLFKKLPGLNQSIAELLGDEVFGAGADFIVGLKDIVDGARGGSLDTVQDTLNTAFNAVLGAGTDPINIVYEDSVLVLEFDFEKALASIERSFSLDLQSFADDLGLPSEFTDAVTDVLTIDTSDVTLFADIVAGFGFGVGLDLSNVFDPQSFLTDDSSIFARLDAGTAAPVDFDVELDLAALGIPGLDALGITTIGFGVDDGTADLNLLLEFGLPETDSGVYLLSEPLPAAEVRVSGDAAIDLPLVIGSVAVGGTTLDQDGDGFGDNVLHIGASLTGADFEFDIVSPGIDQLFSLAGWLNDPQNIVDGLDLLFETLGEDVGAQLQGLGLPLIGDALNDAANFIDDGVDGSGTDLRESVVGTLQSLVDANPDSTTIDLVVDALLAGLDGLIQDDGNGPILVTVGEDFVQFDLVLAGNILSEQVDIDFGLGDLIEIDGQIEIALDYTFGFGFGFSITDGFYLNTDGAVDGGEEFVLALSATVPGLDVTGTLPILAVSAKEIDGDEDGASGLFGSFTVDVQDSGGDGRLSLFGETGSVEARLQALANVDLALEVSIPDPSGAALFPTITTTFHYDQVLADIGTSGSSVGGSPVVVFENVELDLGEFISSFVAPIAAAVGDVTAPLEPLVELLNSPIELLQDFGLNAVTLLDIAEGVLGGSKFAPVISAIEAISDVVELVGDVNDFIAASPGPLMINFGTFTVGGDGNAVADPGNMDPTQQAMDTGSDEASAVANRIGTTKGSFQFPLLTDPSTVFGLLLGKDVDLFLYDMPALDLNFEYIKSVPVFPGLNARFGGAVSASTNFTFGFDTSGFNDWKAGGFAVSGIPLIFNGMFLDDHGIENTASDLPEATVSASIIAGASVGVAGLVEAGVDGSISAVIEFDLNDVPNFFGIYDGKIRGNELLTRLQQGADCVFDTHGELNFGLSAFFWVGADLGFLGKITIFEARETFASGTIANFDHECPDPEEEPLGILAADGTLDLLVEKAEGKPFQVSQELVEVAEGVFEERIILRTGSFFEAFLPSEVTKIITDGSDGIDQIIVGAGIEVDLDLDGGDGNDKIFVSSGGPSIVVKGGDGDDEIVINDSARANLDIDGGDDDDHIMVSSEGGFLIVVNGGDGNDTIIGSDFDDEIHGGKGNDVLFGFAGSDTIYGDEDNDLIFGGDDDDNLRGGTGDDRLAGELGDDILFGEDGDDTLTGGADRDTLDGGRDADTIVWNYGDGEDFLWRGGDGTSGGALGHFVDSVQLSGVVVDANGDTEAFDDTVALTRVAGTADVNVNWQRDGVAGHDRFSSNSSNTFNLIGLEQIITDLGSGSDALTVNDLDGTTVTNLNVNFGTSDGNIRTTVDAANFDADGNFIDFVFFTDPDGNQAILQEERISRQVGPDLGTDTLTLFGSSGIDIYAVEGNPTGLNIDQAKPTATTNRNVLSVSLLNSEQDRDRVIIDTGDGDDSVNASAVGEFNYLDALVINTGDHNDTIIGSPFVDHIDSGFGNDDVTGGAGVDTFTDAGGFDRLFESRDVNFTLSDVELTVGLLGVGVGVDQPDGSIKVTRAVTSTEVENIGGIFEEVYLTGTDQSEGLDGALSVNVFSISDFTKDAFLNGGAAADIYNIQLSGGAGATFSSFIDIIDDGGPQNSGFDVLLIEGTDEADTFGFNTNIVERISSRAEDQGDLSIYAPVEEFSTDIIVRKTAIDTTLNRQVVNYLTTEDMIVHGRGGDDLFLVDDSSTELFVYGDSGDDRFFIGSVLATELVPNPDRPDEMVEVVVRDGGLTNGVSFPASFFGGKGNDYFEVNHNIAEISLFGEDGDDIFFLKALLTTEPNVDDAYQPQEDINVFSEAGENDTLAYVRNAPVNIFGGEGFDTLVIVGTVIDDTFVIFTEFDEELGMEVQRVFGAGLVVPVIDSIERLILITGAGDDTVYLYGTLSDQEIVINTGSGNDLVNIGGDELNFDITIPESQYTKKLIVPRPDIITTETIVTPARTYFTWEFEKLFGFFGPSWIPVLKRNFTPEKTRTRIIRTAQVPLEIPEVVTVPEFDIAITVPESRALDKINGPVFIDGVINGNIYQDGVRLDELGDDSVVIDNRFGDVADPGTLQKQTVEIVDINTTDAEKAAAKVVLAASLPAGIDVDVIYRAVADYLEDEHRVRQPGLVNEMLDDLADPPGKTLVELRPGQRIQAFTSLGDFLAYAPVAHGTYTEVNSVTGITETKTFSLSALSATGGNAFLPDDVFTMTVGGLLQTVEAELLYDVNGNITGVNVFAENAISMMVGNDFVRSVSLDVDSTKTYDALSGFGLGVGIFYENFSIIDLQLSNGSDVLTIADTTADATTNVFGGGGADQIDVLNSSGTLNIFGDVAGSDTADLGISSNVIGRYAEDFRDADNAAALATVLSGVTGSFDADNIAHVRILANALNAAFPGTVNIPDPNNTIFNVINLDTDDYRAQIWELLKKDANTLLGDVGDYRVFLGGVIGAEDFAEDLGVMVGLPAGTVFDAANRDHVIALANAVNAKGFDLTVSIDLTASAEGMRTELDLFSSFVWQVFGADLAPGIVDGNYRDYLAELGVLLELGNDFDLNSRPHLQLLAGLVNDRAFSTTVVIDTTATLDELTAALETFDNFVWSTLKQDLTRVTDTSNIKYNPLSDFGDYRTQLGRLNSLLGLVGAFDPSDVGHVKALSTRLNDQFNDLGINVDGIRLEPNIDLDIYRLQIWQLITEVNPLIEVPSGGDTINVYSTGAEVVIRGQAGDDIVNLQNATLGSWLTALGGLGDDDFNVIDLQSFDSMSDRGDGNGVVRDTVDLDGESGTDDYYVDLTGGLTDYRINVLDTGSAGDGADTLTIGGTAADDIFLMRKVTELPGYSADSPAFVALVKGTLDEVLANEATRPGALERINYDENINGILTVNGLGGDDYFASDDNSATTILDGGADSDTFQIGQIYTTARVEDSLAPEDAFNTVATTRGFLSRGVSFPLTILGGSEDDNIVVYSNGAELKLEGNGGNDFFEVRAFELIAGNGFTTEATTAIDTGQGDDTVQYNINAPVDIDGGTGFDTIVVVGTESDNNFVITDAGVFGAGVTVLYENVESIQIDGLEGNDNFFILSTASGVVTTVIGGLGSDTFNVGGDVTEEIIASDGSGQNDTMTFPAQDHTLTDIGGPLIIEGHYLEGANRSLSAPVMLATETNEALPDGDVLFYDGTGEAEAIDLMRVASAALAAVLPRLGYDPDDFDALIGLTIEITDGAGEARFWSIEGISVVEGQGQHELTLRNPSVLESAGLGDVGLPDTDSTFAISRLSSNFFVNEETQIDRLNVFNDSSLSDDVGLLSAIEMDNSLISLADPLNLSGLGMSGDLVADLGTADPTDDITFAGGITTDDLEIFEIMLGQGNDTLTIEETLRNPELHGGLTIVHGGGNQLLQNGEMGGDTIIVNGGGGPASPLVVYGDTSQDGQRYTGVSGEVPDDLPLAIQFGAAGNDTIDARNSSLGVVVFGGAGDDLIYGSQAGDHLTGGSGNDEIHGDGGTDLIFGDSGINVDPLSRLLDVPTVNSSVNPNRDSLDVGDDLLFGDADEDIIFGDHGIITQLDPAAALLTTSHPAIARIESAVIDEGGEDIIYGGSGADILIGGANSSNVLGDAIDGGSDDDLIFGDNVVLNHRAAGTQDRTADGRLRTLDGSLLYNGQGGIADMSDVTGAHPQIQGVHAQYQIVDLDHSLAIQDAAGTNFGSDYLAGGADDDMIFGQLGDDVIQGDAGIGDGITDRVGASRDATTGELILAASTEADTDGDDYIEGNGGKDVVFGNLGQDDIIGGSSELFTLTSPELRPDDADMLFGGSGQRIGRNYQVETDTDADTIFIESVHARDADAIAGDNANIFRLVGINGINSGFLNFEYDSGRGSEQIIVRAVQLLDYTPGGLDYDAAAAGDIGAGDEIHGGSGDDFIYGMKGNDVIFGDSEDDDLIGGYDQDWISGGSGSDGVLGDDGRIYTSRNTPVDGGNPLAEPLYGIAKIENPDAEISTPGNAQQAIINVTGELKKTVNLTPFNVDPNEDNLYPAESSDDIIFGGIGNDFLHGGSGDDAISGAEALASSAVTLYPSTGGPQSDRTDGTILHFGYDNPVNPGNVIGYSALRAGEFAAYDEFSPLQTITVDGAEYFLNFNTDEGDEVAPGVYSDGDDVIFGDLGNDWIVGGTGGDHLFGGRGDDYLNADDDLSTNGGLNDIPDTQDSYADLAFGGAGRDVLIANTAVDRLIDWAGEFNTYLVPFAPFGNPTISRALPPRLFDFLYQLSASDGADPTRGADEGTGSDDARNGEPFGELGLVTQKDFDWQNQTGAPADVQPGNIPGGSRDVVRAATFNQATADGFLADVGDWTVSNSRLQVEPEQLGGDAVSVFYVDEVLPMYFEMQATIQGGKPTGGYKSNSYLIFDYQSPTDFKFAGVNISTDKLEVGHRDADGWHIDVNVSAQLRPDRDYNLLLAINGNAATLVVNNQDVLNHTFDARIDEDGFSYGLNSGMVGIGAFNSKARIDNVKVQVLPRDVMAVRESDFTTGPADFLSGGSAGNWTVADDRLTGDASTNGIATGWGGDIAFIDSDVLIGAGQVLEIETTLAEGAAGGIVFDQYSESDYKFVYIDASGQVSIGHQSGGSWAIEATAQMPAQVNGDYDIKVSLVGSTVSVIIDNQSVVSHAYNALTGDGRIGLMVAQGSSAGFDSITISTNDPAYLDESTGDPLRATGEAAATPGVALDAGVDLQPMLDAAASRWEDWTGQSLPGVEDLSIWVTDLPGELLGLTVGDVIYVDRDAAGLGWFIDTTPQDDANFDSQGNALAGTAAARGVDLLSVVVHEVGHVLGFDHESLQTSTLSIGERVVPELRELDDDRSARRSRMAGRFDFGSERQWSFDKAAVTGLLSSHAASEQQHRNREVVSELMNSLVDAGSRIVPVNLGMFGAVHRQIPWAFPNSSSVTESGLHAIIWDEDVGEFQPAQPLQATREADDHLDIIEFLEETGEWIS